MRSLYQKDKKRHHQDLSVQFIASFLPSNVVTDMTKLRRDSVDLTSIPQVNGDIKSNEVFDEVKTLKVIKEFLPSWRHLSPGDISMKRLAGGLCNSIFAVYRKDESNESHEGPRNVVVHINGGVMFGRQQVLETSNEASQTDTRNWNEPTQEVSKVKIINKCLIAEHHRLISILMTDRCLL